jgi:molybdenum cofactor cytidylyltransferase
MQTFAIIPAAGRSERMGRAKLLLPWGKQTLIEHVLDIWRQGGVDRRIVVVHPDDQELAALCRDTGATVCVPITPPPEMKDSVQAGLALAEELFHPTDNDAWLLAPADLPLLTPRLIGMIIDEHRKSPRPIVAPRLPSGRTGHPVLFCWRLAVEIQLLKGGIHKLLERHPVQYVEWQEADAFVDIDTVDDYHRLHNRHCS